MATLSLLSSDLATSFSKGLVIETMISDIELQWEKLYLLYFTVVITVWSIIPNTEVLQYMY